MALLSTLSENYYDNAQFAVIFCIFLFMLKNSELQNLAIVSFFLFEGMMILVLDLLVWFTLELNGKGMGFSP